MKLYYNNDICPKCGNLTDHRNGLQCSDCFKAYRKAYRKAHREEIKAYMKEYHKAYHKAYQKAHKEELKEYKKTNRNSNRITLDNIRAKSNYYLFNQLNHTKLDNYEIHHCFSYNDYTKFIYIPKSLHLKIHKYLRDNKIDAKSEHYNEIVQLINECTEYTYIHV